MEVPNFIKVKDQSYVFANDGTFKFFIPEKYFDTKLAEIQGDFVNLFGICTYAIYDKNDKVYITDVYGDRVEYTIYNIYETSPDDSDFIMRETNGKREISLSTCTDNSKARLIIWAVEE